MATLGIALIGAGGMGMGLARAAKRREDVRIVAVVDPNAEAAAKAVAELGGEAFASVEDILTHPEVQAVIVATPNPDHRPITIAAAYAGKHIFCEKPMALCVSDCDAMIAAAKRSGVKLMVGQVLRLIPGFAKTREIVLSGELGKPLAVAIERSSYWVPGAWRTNNDLTGGVLFEVNVHELDFMRSLLGDARRVYASIPAVMLPGTNTPAINYVTVDFKEGGVGLLNSNSLLPQGQYQIAITCEKGSARCAWGEVSYQLHGGEKQVVPQEQIEKMVQGVDWEIGSFVEWVLNDTAPVVTAQDGRAAVELAQAAVRSGATGQPVELPLR